MPVVKHLHDTVIAGTINGSGSITIRADKLGEDTLLAQIVKAASQAQRSRVPIQKLVDRVSAYFVPTVLIIAAATFIAWYMFAQDLANAMLNAVAVLIVACPCALGLATPMSIITATGRGATAGVLIKDAESLQKLEQIDTIVIDKTGTLTEGKPSVTEMGVTTGWTIDQLLQSAGSLERLSEHPIAKAISQECRKRKIGLKDVTSYQAVAGSGATALMEGKAIQLGNANYLLANDIQLDSLDKKARLFLEQGQTIVYVAQEGKAIGFIALSDRPKAGAKELISELVRCGLRVIVMSGDSKAATESICKMIGVTDFIGECTPFSKAEHVIKIQEQGAKVAMAGDGINDAFALSAASVGIAMGSGTDLAIQSADLILVKGDLSALNRAIKLGRAMMTNIRQNLFLAFVYNALAIPIAAGVLYPSFGITLSPMIASAAMSLSSVSVIGNSLRLRTLKL